MFVVGLHGSHPLSIYGALQRVFNENKLHFRDF